MHRVFLFLSCLFVVNLGLSVYAPAQDFFYIEPFVSIFYSQTAGQNYNSRNQGTLLSQTNLGFGFQERENFHTGWAILAKQELSQVQYYNDPTANINFRQNIYSDLNLGIGNNNEGLNLFEYSIHLGVKERAFFDVDTINVRGIDKFFVDYFRFQIYRRIFENSSKNRFGVGLSGDYLLGMHRSNYNVNDGNSFLFLLRWERMVGNNLLNLEFGYQTTIQNTNLDSLTEQIYYLQALFSNVF